MRECKAVGTLIVPMWKSSYFWSLLCNDGMHLNSFIKHWLCLPKRPDLFVAGRAKNKLLGTKVFLYLTPRPLLGLPAVAGFPGMHFPDKLGFFNLLIPLFWGEGGFILHCPVDWVELFDFQSFIMFPPPGGLRDVLYVPPVVRAC